jgi:PAS domain S-box-containing protein
VREESFFGSLQPWRRRLQSAAGAAILALVYYAAARVGLMLQLPGTNVSPFWPPSGVALAAVLRFGVRVWPGIAMGAFFANFLTLPPTTGLIASLGIAVGTTLEQVVAGLWMRRIARNQTAFNHAHDVFGLAAAAFVSCAIASSIGATSLWLTGIISSEIYKTVWFTWWTGDTVGMLVFAPLFYCWLREPRWRYGKKRLVEFLALLVATAAIAELLFGPWIKSELITSLPYLVVPTLLWSAFRFGPRETATAVAVSSFVAVVRTWQHMARIQSGQIAIATFSPFVGHTLTPNQSLLMVQVFVSVLPLTAVTLAAAIGERAHFQDELAEAEKQLRTIFEQAAVGVALVETASGRFVRINDRYCAIVGYSREEMTGRTFQSITHPQDVAPDLDLTRRMIAGDIREFKREKRYFRKDGSIVWVKLTASATWRPGEKPGYHITVADDITAQKRAEEERAQLLDRERSARAEAERANQLKDQFLALCSHELRTPLTPIVGWIRMLRASPLHDKRVEHAMEVIERNAGIEARLVDDLLDVSRILSGKLKLQVGRVDMIHVVQDALESVNPAAKAKGVRVETSLDPMVTEAPGDPNRFQQIVSNLLSNAVKFTPSGRVVRLRLEQDASDIKIIVVDEGEGISAEFLPHVFETFRQANTSATRPHGGLGLGLSIVKTLVELHGGSITAASPGKDKGATFIVTLPRFKQFDFEKQPEPSRSRSTQKIPEAPLRGRLILVVDDDPDTCDVLVAALQSSGATVLSASSAKDALHIVERDHPDLLISDIAMPNEDGYMLIKKIRELNNEFGRIPAIALTAYTKQEDRVRALATGFQEHMAKPVEPAELEKVIFDLIGEGRS